LYSWLSVLRFIRQHAGEYLSLIVHRDADTLVPIVEGRGCTRRGKASPPRSFERRRRTRFSGADFERANAGTVQSF
jgi:hypothetical protein